MYAASEGLSVVAFDCRGPGGQAGNSARIENFLDFPTGITGHALAARALAQAQKPRSRRSLVITGASSMSTTAAGKRIHTATIPRYDCASQSRIATFCTEHKDT
ncbi:hypothetical protein [Paraburkholderia strydomiana]